MVKKQKSRVESFKLHGRELVDKVKELVDEGNVRRIIIKSKEGKTVMEVPVTIGVVGAVVAPVLAAVGAIAAILTECTITVKRESHK
ncbi:MAG: DUF4342 domain-containing protein [Patescibacteria group bacterium]|jgi:hypothetical protein